MIQVSNKNGLFAIEDIGQDKAKINKKEASYSLEKISGQRYHLIFEYQSFEVELVGHNRDEKTIMVKLGNKEIQFEYKTETDILLESMGFEISKSAVLREFKAPMPGLVVDILVNEGDNISKGDALMVLEAMKMENILKSPGDAVIKKIEVSKGAAVEKNQKLISFQ